MDFIRSLFKGDKYIWGIYIVLAIFSTFTIFSATSTLAYRASDHFSPGLTHMTYLILGTLGVLVMHNWPPSAFRGIGYILLPVSLALLVLVKFTPGVNGAQRWIFGIQPSELAKFALIIVVSHLLAKGQTEKGIDSIVFRKVLVVSGLVCGCIVTENFSTAFLLGTIVFFLMFVARVEWKRLLIITGSVVGGGLLFLSILIYTPDQYLPGRMLTWKNRIERSSDDTPLVTQSMDDKNMQVMYGHMAVARGGMFGVFFGNSQIRDFLPQAYSDYIFSIIIEETGLFLGALVVMLCYFLLLIRAGIIFRRCNKPFYGFLLLGATMIIVFQAFINMAVGVDLIPVTGQPLPLISRGGTSMFLTCGYFGMILSISRIAGMGEEDEEDEFLPQRNTMSEEEIDRPAGLPTDTDEVVEDEEEVEYEMPERRL